MASEGPNYQQENEEAYQRMLKDGGLDHLAGQVVLFVRGEYFGHAKNSATIAARAFEQYPDDTYLIQDVLRPGEEEPVISFPRPRRLVD